MSSKDDIVAAIAAKGDEIKNLKAQKPPTMKEDLAPLISELLALKLSYKEVTGEDFGGPAPVKEKKKAPVEKPAEEVGVILLALWKYQSPSVNNRVENQRDLQRKNLIN